MKLFLIIYYLALISNVMSGGFPVGKKFCSGNSGKTYNIEFKKYGFHYYAENTEKLKNIFSISNNKKTPFFLDLSSEDGHCWLNYSSVKFIRFVQLGKRVNFHIYFHSELFEPVSIFNVKGLSRYLEDIRIELNERKIYSSI
jgi:hypothetical protein